MYKSHSSSLIVRWVLILGLALGWQTGHVQAQEWQADTNGHRTIIAPFIKKHCLRCHGPKNDEGEFRVDQHLKNEFLDRATKEKWGEVVKMLNSHEMPPEDEPQPRSSEVTKVVDWITRQMAKAELIRRDTSIVLRRMNRAEYQNTIRDLIGVDFDTSGFPQDPPAGGFDNNGGALTISPLHLELYYKSARQILDVALVEGNQPPSLKWRFEVESGNSDGHRVNYDGQRVIVNGGKNPAEKGLLVMRLQQWDRNINCRDFTVPYAGDYVIRVRAAGRIPDRKTIVTSAEKFLTGRRDDEIKKNPRVAPYWVDRFPRELNHFKNDRMYDLGAPRLKLTLNLGGQPIVVSEFDVPAPESQPNVYSFTTKFKPVKSGIKIEPCYSIPAELENFWMQRHENFPRPEALVDWIELEGPVYESWPPPSHKMLLFDSPAKQRNERAYAREVVAKFMKRAFRRPIQAAEIDVKMALYDRARQDAASFIQAIKTPLSAVMISPHFLYLAEPSNENARVSDTTPESNGSEIAVARKPSTSELRPVPKAIFETVFLKLPAPQQETKVESKLPSPFRIFRTTRGRRLRGRITAVKGLNVSFQQTDKTIVTLRLTLFAAEDRKYIRSLIARPTTKPKTTTPRPKPTSPKTSPTNPKSSPTPKPTTPRPTTNPTSKPSTGSALPTNDSLRRLTDYEIASRLSYFLWSSMPDDELFAVADAGRLTDKAEILKQVDRMLGDPKSQAFVENFAGQWLGLREVGANPPAPDRYPRYDRHLEVSIIQESQQFFAEILHNDLSVMNFVSSDFVVVNERLARFYSIPNVKGDHFRRVKVPAGVHRGGVITQASMLTTTSNGTRTSPVKRGTWVMKNVLGIDPGLPVANAGDIAPKVPGIDKATVRKRLEIHRSLPQCARCHNKIDPLGFGLENFNAAGEWREQEGFGYKGRIGKNDPKIDASAKMIDGTEFTGVDGLQKVLLKQEDLFLNCLSGKIFTYALGRELGIADQIQVKAAINHLQSNDDSLRVLIKYIATSEPFLTK